MRRGGFWARLRWALLWWLLLPWRDLLVFLVVAVVLSYPLYRMFLFLADGADLCWLNDCVRPPPRR